MKLKRASSLTLIPWVYRLWQAPFVAKKLEPLVRHNDLSEIRQVLDVGCGPGSNAPTFADVEYLGIDIEEQYVASARNRHRGSFEVADARTFEPQPGESFDCILLNSLLHHLDRDDVRLVLRRLERLLTDDGSIHVIDLVLPEEKGIPRWLAESDRGDHPRRLGEWKTLFSEAFESKVFEPFTVSLAGVGLWDLVYFKGGRKGGRRTSAT